MKLCNKLKTPNIKNVKYYLNLHILILQKKNLLKY